MRHFTPVPAWLPRCTCCTERVLESDSYTTYLPYHLRCRLSLFLHLSTRSKQVPQVATLLYSISRFVLDTSSNCDVTMVRVAVKLTPLKEYESGSYFRSRVHSHRTCTRAADFADRHATSMPSFHRGSRFIHDTHNVKLIPRKSADVDQRNAPLTYAAYDLKVMQSLYNCRCGVLHPCSGDIVRYSGPECK